MVGIEGWRMAEFMVLPFEIDATNHADIVICDARVDGY